MALALEMGEYLSPHLPFETVEYLAFTQRKPRKYVLVIF